MTSIISEDFSPAGARPHSPICLGCQSISPSAFLFHPWIGVAALVGGAALRSLRFARSFTRVTLPSKAAAPSGEAQLFA